MEAFSSIGLGALHDRTINFEEIDLQEDMSYHEHPVAILGETERKTRNKSIKILKVKWSHHSD